MGCPNCGTNDVWDDNAHWGCNKCDWSSLAGLNKTRTASNPGDKHEVERRAIDFPRWQREKEEAANSHLDDDEDDSGFCCNCDKWIQGDLYYHEKFCGY